MDSNSPTTVRLKLFILECKEHQNAFVVMTMPTSATTIFSEEDRKSIMESFDTNNLANYLQGRDAARVKGDSTEMCGYDWTILNRAGVNAPKRVRSILGGKQDVAVEFHLAHPGEDAGRSDTATPGKKSIVYTGYPREDDLDKLRDRLADLGYPCTCDYSQNRKSRGGQRIGTSTGESQSGRKETQDGSSCPTGV